MKQKLLFFLTSLISDNQWSPLLCKVIAGGGGRLPKKGSGRRGRSAGVSSGEEFMPKSIFIIVHEKACGTRACELI